MMDRNIGATSSTPGEVGALGLMYQWGRKDPFMGSSSISSSVLALSTGTWNITSGGSTTKAEENPMRFYTSMYLPDGSWDSAKTIYDPCPAGWRVPDGGENSVWAKALGESKLASLSYDSTNKGINVTRIFGEATSIWYPASGDRYNSSGELGKVGDHCYYWSCSPVENTNANAYNLYISYSGSGNPSSPMGRAYGYPARCLKE